MRLEALRRILETQSRAKVFVLTGDSCLCGYVSKPRLTEQGLLVDVGSSLRVGFDTLVPVYEPMSTGTMQLTDSCKVTRRLQTHRRHLASAGRVIPEDYFRRSMII
ncbi:MAG TPA: hypothetical protein VK348_10050 [Planctomycetota bacterium]|nr:hypothetical protein [Planctomycetota bacterium]